MPPPPRSQGNFFKLDTRRVLLRTILVAKSHVLQFSPNRILHVYSLLRSPIVHNFLVHMVGLCRMHAPTARICSERCFQVSCGPQQAAFGFALSTEEVLSFSVPSPAFRCWQIRLLKQSDGKLDGVWRMRLIGRFHV